MKRPGTVLDEGIGEGSKCGVHAALLGLAAICLTYNATGFITRRQRHLAVNTVLYGGLLVWEWLNVRHHWEHR